MNNKNTLLGAAMTVKVELYVNPDRHKCFSLICDGRPAKWIFPQTDKITNGPIRSCSVHVARHIEVVLDLYEKGLIAQ